MIKRAYHCSRYATELSSWASLYFRFQHRVSKPQGLPVNMLQNFCTGFRGVSYKTYNKTPRFFCGIGEIIKFTRKSYLSTTLCQLKYYFQPISVFILSCTSSKRSKFCNNEGRSLFIQPKRSSNSL